MKSTIYFFLAALFCITSMTLTQETPQWNTPSSVVWSSGEYVSLPQQPYVHRIVQPWHVVTPYEDLLVFPNIRVLPTSNQQTETPLVISRNTPTFMFGSSNRTSGSNINSGSYITTNGGVTWFGQDYINNGNTNNQRGDPGPAIGMNNRVVFTHLSSNTNFGSVTGMAAEYSTDFGQTFSASFQVHLGGQDDKNLACGDDVPTSPYYGNFYMAFCNYATGTTFVNRTTNGGVSWDPAVSWAPSGGLYAQGHDIVTMPNGNVVTAYALRSGSSPYTELAVGIGMSTNGGVSFTQNQPAFTVNGTRSGSFNGWGIRTNAFPRIACDKSGGARNGWLYVVVDEVNHAPAGSDADVVLYKSTNGGLNWSAGVRVNQDAPNNGKVQFFPCVAVDENGGVNVAYYDNRAFPSVGDSCSVYISRSLDGGNTWSDVEVADHHFRPKPTPGLSLGYMGDYIGIAAGNGKVWAFWMDDKLAYPVFQAMAGYMQSGPPPANDVAVGPFLSFPTLFLINNNYTIRARVANVGTNGQTNLPIRFSINGILQSTNTIPSLPPSAVDSSSFTWTPTAAGPYVLRIFSGASVDQNRLNDTVTASIQVLSQLPALCEQFTSTTFPPDNWTLTNGGNYWGRHTASGFGLGSGSARYNMWSAPVGTDQAMITHQFPPVVNVSGVVIDFAYSPYPTNPPYSQDSLIIFASTNGGSTYSTVVRLGPTQLQTVASSSSQFVPTANSWVKRAYPIPIGTNKIQILGRSQYGNDLFLDSICIVPFSGITQNGNSLPTVYSLSQNYPNPFNPVTLISFGLPKPGLTKLVIYDILGREVSVLVNEYKEPGFYKVDFDGTNFASGVYLYKIESGSFSDIKKMVIMK